MGVGDLLDRLYPTEPLERRIGTLAVESDSAVDTARAFGLKIVGEGALIFPVGTGLGVSVDWLAGTAVGVETPVTPIAAGSATAFAFRAFCTFGPLSEN